MIYLDANFFINAVIGSEETSTAAKNIIVTATGRNISFYTSLLTFDEVLYILMKKTNIEDALKAAQDFFNMTNLIKLPVTANIISESFDIVSNYKLQPRDSIHVASMKLNNLNAIVSADADFDKLPWLKRYNAIEFAELLQIQDSDEQGTEDAQWSQ